MDPSPLRSVEIDLERPCPYPQALWTVIEKSSNQIDFLPLKQHLAHCDDCRQKVLNGQRVLDLIEHSIPRPKLDEEAMDSLKFEVREQLKILSKKHPSQTKRKFSQVTKGSILFTRALRETFFAKSMVKYYFLMVLMTVGIKYLQN